MHTIHVHNHVYDFEFLQLLEYLNQEVIEAIIFVSFISLYLKFNAPARVKLVVEYSHVHISSLLCSRACSKSFSWFEEEGKLIWDRASGERSRYCLRGTYELARSPAGWVIIDIGYPKRIFCAVVCDSKLYVPVSSCIKHRPVYGSCDLDGNG